MKPVVDRLAQEYSENVEFVIYGNVDGSAEIQEFTQDKGLEWVPTMVLVSPEGTELQRWEGAVPEAALRPWLENPE